jgi:hypothetical protein
MEEATSLQSDRVLRMRGLLAEFSTGQAPSGEWFALGTVRAEDEVRRQPAWMLVGTGKTVEDAVSRLLNEMEHAAQRYFAR